jgi:hypothetical protein
MTSRKPLVRNTALIQELQGGDTLQLPASVTGGASMNLAPGVAPTSPNNGDVWITSAGIYVQIAGATIGPLGTGGGGSGAYVLLQSQTVTGSSVASVSFTSIPSTYKNLKLIISARGSAAATAVNLHLRMNNDSTANYDWVATSNNSASVQGTPNATQTSIRIGAVSAASAVNSSRFGIVEATLFHYANSIMEKDLMSFEYDNDSHSTGTLRLQQFGGTWRSTTTINRVDLLMDNGNIDVGSTFDLYGMN